MLDQLKMFARYALGLNTFLRGTLGPEECGRIVRDGLESRERSFLAIMERVVYPNPRNPYFKLLKHAGVEYGDLVRLIAENGLEGALGRLYDAGVYTTLAEFKRRIPIRRPGLEIEAGPHDFDNPFLSGHYASRTSGSRGAGTRVILDLDLLLHDAACSHFLLTAFDLYRRPAAIWREVPPVTTGVNVLLRLAKLGKTVEKWFSSSRFRVSPKYLPFLIFTYYTVYASRLRPRPLPSPVHNPLENASGVARWLSEKSRNGTPAFLDTQASTCVRTCAAAIKNGIDIRGTSFIIGGEPYTEAKAEVVTDAGCRAINRYSMAELGNLGFACSNPSVFDDIHLVSDKVAVIQREKRLGAGELSVGALVYTTILPHCPKLMLNMESDDYGIVEKRECGCPLGDVGFTTHVSGLRSYEKLTSGGVTFLGTELLRLIEEVLPKTFGGHPTDYQLVEEEEGGLPRVNVVVSPRVGAVDEGALISKMIETLNRYPGGEIMSDQWAQGGTLRVLRREPYVTSTAKILPLHILKGGGG